jgi:hypothetical protein
VVLSYQSVVSTLDLKKQFGDEYPAAIVRNGSRMPLSRESRFSRMYDSDDKKSVTEISRFMDGSASITALEVQHEWASWTDNVRTDFCQSCCWLRGQTDFPEILRFIMEHGDSEHWSGVALSVATVLPRDEAFDTLVRALRRTELGHSSNICQGIAKTQHPDAETTLRGQLASLWEHPALWDEKNFWVGFDAITCIAHLIELGAPPSDFTNQVHRLSEHNRKSCQAFLSKHYAWLKGRDGGAVS